jgi:uncharacterized protein (DUF983 family)
MEALSTTKWWHGGLGHLGRLTRAVLAAGMTFFAGLILGVAADQGTNRTLMFLCNATMLLLPPVLFVAILLMRRLWLSYLVLVPLTLALCLLVFEAILSILWPH